MDDFLKKQKLFKLMQNVSLTVTAVIIFIYIGAEPYIEDAFGNTLPLQLVLFALVLFSAGLLFLYQSKYSKAADFIEDIMYEVNDCGYYLNARKECTTEEFINSVSKDLKENGFKTELNSEVNSLNFDVSAFKGIEFVYIVNTDNVDKNDVVVYSDSALYDVMQNKMKSKGSCVLVFVCNKADESAIALSKAISRTFSGKRVLKTGIAVAELSTNRVYFRGNEPSVIQKLVANYVMNCEIPIKERFKGNERLNFQYELENKLKSFNLNDFNSGKFFER